MTVRFFILQINNTDPNEYIRNEYKRNNETHKKRKPISSLCMFNVNVLNVFRKFSSHFPSSNDITLTTGFS